MDEPRDEDEPRVFDPTEDDYDPTPEDYYDDPSAGVGYIPAPILNDDPTGAYDSGDVFERSFTNRYGRL